MKKQFSKNWLSSKQPRKQKKYRANAPIHRRKKMIASKLSKKLREKYNKRTMPLRVGDEVKIMRGSFKGKKTKIESVNLKKLKVYCEDAQRKKANQQDVNVPIDPSNLMITSLNLDDRKRVEVLKNEKK